MSALRVGRFSFCGRRSFSLFLLVLVTFGLQLCGAAQTAAADSTPATSSAIRGTSSQQLSTPPDATQQMQTAAQIEVAAQKEATADPDASTPVARATVPPSIATAGSGHLAAKYDVSMIGQRNVGSGLDFYSIDREIALGRSLAHQVEDSARLVTDPVVTEYVNRIGQSLVRNSDARVPFTIKILDTDEVNAFALPGGFFYVNSGLILAADNEAELAAVMAHEIAHVAARHATKNMTKAQIFNIASVPLIFIGGPIAYAISEVASIALPLSMLKFSRDAEREADLLGLEYDYAAGYDPQAFVQFFEKLKVVEKRKQSMVAKAFATHPMNADRIKAAQDEIRSYLPDRPEYVVDTSEFQDVKARLLSLENSRRLGGPKDTKGPVLLRRAGSSGGDSGGATSPNDDDRPVLKQAPSASDPDKPSTQNGTNLSQQSGNGGLPALRDRSSD